MRKTWKKVHIIPIATFTIALIYSSPIFYMLMSSFRPEKDVAPPSLRLNFTLDNYRTVMDDEFIRHLMNSIGVVSATVILTIILGVPIAYVIALGNLKNPQSHYNWYLTTTFLPAVAVLIPIYLIVSRIGLLDSPILLIFLYTAAGIPIVVWLSTTYLLDIPISILEATTLDGCNRWQSFRYVIAPTIRGGIASTALLIFVLTWNEFLFAIAFTYTKSGTLPVFMNRYMTQQGLFWGKMSAAATLAIIIPVALGFFAQKSLVKGMLAGSVKE